MERFHKLIPGMTPNVGVASPKPTKVLLIEDDPGDARLLQEALRAAGTPPFELIQVTYLDEGLKRLSERDIDVVLLDLSLPDASGVDTILRTRAASPEVPILVMTGLNDEELAIQALREGVQDYLVKGQMDGHLLVRAISYAIERKRIEEALRKVHGELEMKVQERTAELLRANAELKSVILECKRVEERLQEETRIIETLHRVGRSLTAELDLRKLVQAITDEATALIGAEFGAFFYNIVSEQGEAYRLYTLSGAPHEAFSQFPMPRNTAVFERTFRGEGIIRLEDVTQDPRYGKNPPYYGMPKGHLPVRSYLAVPVISRSGKVMGGLFFGHSTPGVFTERDERLIAGIAAQATIALDNAQLYSSAQQELTERKQAEERLARIVETITEGILILNPEGRITFANPAAEKMTGLTFKELTRRTYNDPAWKTRTLEGKPCREEDQSFVRVMRTGKPVYNVESMIERPDGTQIVLSNSSAPLRDATGAIVGVVSSLTDITERKRTEELIRHLAYYDALTGLPNRVLFKEHFVRELAHARRHQYMLAVMFLDLDRFKIINDTLGHSIGDRLLQGVAHRLKGCLREGDIVARLGGDEFLLLLPRITQSEDASKIGRRILETLRPPFHFDNREFHITASMGIALYPQDGKDIQTLMKNADIAMYRAKEQGRNAYQFYTPTMNAAAFERLTLENDLRRALEREEFLVYYQPQVSLITGQIVGAEALVLWQHPELGPIPPMKFIPLAEETGLIVPVGEWVLRTVCLQNQVWQEAGFPPLRTSVNLSVRLFKQQNLIGSVARLLKETQLNPQYLGLELTESMIMENPETAIQKLRDWKAMGIHLFLDDFGTGYSSLTYLKRLPLDALKIDRSFVQDIPADPDDAAIASLIIAMAHNLKLKVIAEGVETEEQLEFLRSHRCDEMQGHLFGEPVPAGAFTQLLRERRHWTGIP